MVNTDERQKFTRQGLTFDDVLLIPARATSCPQTSICIPSSPAGSGLTSP